MATVLADTRRIVNVTAPQIAARNSLIFPRNARNDRPNSCSDSVRVGIGGIFEHRIHRAGNAGNIVRRVRRGSRYVPTESRMWKSGQQLAEILAMEDKAFAVLRVIEDPDACQLKRDRINIADDGDALAELDAILIAIFSPMTQAVRSRLKAASCSAGICQVLVDIEDHIGIDRKTGEEILGSFQTP